MIDLFTLLKHENMMPTFYATSLYFLVFVVWDCVFLHVETSNSYFNLNLWIDSITFKSMNWANGYE